MEPKVIKMSSWDHLGGDTKKDTEKFENGAKMSSKGPPKASKNHPKCDLGPLRGPRGTPQTAEVPPGAQKSPKSIKKYVKNDEISQKIMPKNRQIC